MAEKNENQASDEEIQKWHKETFKEPESGKNPDGTTIGEDDE